MAPPPSTKAQLDGFLKDPRILPFINYALLAMMVMSLGLTGVLVLIICTFVEDKAPDWIKDHYEFQKRTFWLGIGPILLTAGTWMVLARVLPQPVLIALLMLTLILIIGRCIIGFNHLLYHRAYPNPKTWTV